MEIHDNIFIDRFRTAFGIPPEYYVVAPGRVNLIGEHTDYNGLPVLPAAIPRAVRALAAKRGDALVTLYNTNPHYRPLSFALSPNLDPSTRGRWDNYVKAAAQILIRTLNRSLNGMNLLVDGDIPPAAGLSSSSALVIAAALGLLAVNEIAISPLELASLLAEGERYVGTRGGGMDQAVCLMGCEGSAVRIDFEPLRCRHIPVPDSFAIVVAHSLVRASKTGSTQHRYNSRPAECRLAVTLINSVHELDPPLTRLSELIAHPHLMQADGPERFLERTFPRERYSPADIAESAGISVRTFLADCFPGFPGDPDELSTRGFPLCDRVRHVITEAGRVEESCDALERGDMTAFGALMNQSHESCRDLYDISTPEMDVLVTILREAGALGARLTGAGFGGCSIGLIRSEDVQKTLDTVAKQYYHSYIQTNRPDLVPDYGQLGDLLFTVTPAGGARTSRI